MVVAVIREDAAIPSLVGTAVTTNAKNDTGFHPVSEYRGARGILPRSGNPIPSSASRNGRQSDRRVNPSDVNEYNHGGPHVSKTGRGRGRGRWRSGTSPSGCRRSVFWFRVIPESSSGDREDRVSYGSCPITRSSDVVHESRTLCDEHWPPLRTSNRATDAVGKSRHLFKNACNARKVSAMGASCSSSFDDEPSRGRRQIPWAAAALPLRGPGRNQGHRIKPSSYPSQWLRHAVASTKGASLAFFSLSSSSSYPSSPSSPSSPAASDVEVAVQELWGAQLGAHDHGEGPKLSMFDQDFIVTSSLREHLLLMIALSRKVANADTAFGEAASGSARPKRRAQVFKGNFKAVSTFVAFKLGRDAQRVLHEPNAGGSSSISEVCLLHLFSIAYIFVIQSTSNEAVSTLR